MSVTREEIALRLARWFGADVVAAMQKLIAQRLTAESRSQTQASRFVPHRRPKAPSRRRIKARLRQGKWVSKQDIVQHRLTSFMLNFHTESHEYLYFVRRST